MLSIVLWAFWPCVCFLWRNVYLDLLPIFCQVVYFLILSYLCILEINPLSVSLFFPILQVVFLFYGFFCCAKAFKFNQVPFVYFFFYFHYSRRQLQKELAVIHVKECPAYVFLLDFYNIQSYIQAFNLFLCMVVENVLIQLSFFLHTIY